MISATCLCMNNILVALDYIYIYIYIYIMILIFSQVSMMFSVCKLWTLHVTHHVIWWKKKGHSRYTGSNQLDVAIANKAAIKTLQFMFCKA